MESPSKTSESKNNTGKFEKKKTCNKKTVSQRV